MRVFVATTDSGEIVGTIACRVSEQEGISAGWRSVQHGKGAGIAARLLNAAETELRDWNRSRVTLDTTEPPAQICPCSNSSNRFPNQSGL